MEEYKVTLWKMLKPNIGIMLSLLFFLCFMGLIMLSSFSQNGYIPDLTIIVTIVVVIVFGGPGFILHLNYYKEDQKKKLIVDFNDKLITVCKDGLEKRFHFDEIARVEKTGMVPSRSYKYSTTAPWRYFYFYKVVLLDKSFIILTRFLVEDFEKMVPNVSFYSMQENFPLVKK
ncbi:MAG: hypothetical protein R6U64_08430 [Bacteroidales bacterium]